MTLRTALVSWPWKIAVGALAYTIGAVLGSGALVTALSLEMPQVPGVVDPTLQSLMLIPGGLVFSLGLAAMAVGLAGRMWERWLILTLFLWGINGVGNAIETTIFTTLGGPVGAALAFLPPAALCALAVTWLFPGPSEQSLAKMAREFISTWKPSQLAIRIVLAILAFPIIYFVFGLVVAPIVVPYYEQLDFLKIPAMSTLLPVLLLRSTLILLVTLPVIVGWGSARARAILGLGLGNAVAVGLGGLAQVTFFPATLRWVHGAEILVDGLVYGLVLVLLFFPRLAGEQEVSKEQFKRAYERYRSDGDGWTDDYWQHFFAEEEGKRYFLSRPESPKHDRLFLTTNAIHRHMYFLSSEQEERFFDYPGKS